MGRGVLCIDLTERIKKSDLHNVSIPAINMEVCYERNAVQEVL